MEQSQAATQDRRENSPQSAVPLAYRAVRNGVWVALGSYWVIGFGFIANIALIRLLTPAIYGEFALAMFFYTLFDLQSKVGLNFAFAQQREVNGETLGTLFVISVLLGAGTLILGLLAAPALRLAGYPAEVALLTIILCALAFVGSWTAALGILLEADLHYKPLSIATSVAVPLSYAPAFWLAYQGLGQYSLISQSVAYQLTMIAATVLYFVYRRRDVLRLRWRFEPALASQYVKFGLVAGLSQFTSILLTQADNFILGTLTGATTLGYYDRAYRVAQWPALLLNTLLGRAATFTYAQVRDDAQRLKRSIEMVLWISVQVAAPIALMLFISAPDLVQLLFGAQWLPAVAPLRVLLFAALIRALWENSWAIFIGTGHPRRIIELSLFQLVILGITGTALSAMLSAIGMAISVVIMFGAGVMAAYRVLRRSLPLQIGEALSGPLIASALTLAGYLLLVRLVGSAHPLWFSVAWKASWGLAGFALFSLLVQPRQFTTHIGYTWRLLRGRA